MQALLSLLDSLRDPGLALLGQILQKKRSRCSESDMRQGWQVSLPYLPDLASELTADSHHVTLWPLHYISCWARQFMINQLIALADSTAEVLSVGALSQQQVSRPCLLICISSHLIRLAFIVVWISSQIIFFGNKKNHSSYPYHPSIQLRTTLVRAMFVKIVSSYCWCC